ncbi:hypothetical protein MH928_17430 [Flavobacterium sp. WW92]|uniref:hypothetical protein n=1 Tax=unclassified Flavobacterium TaxID=196869 RepID=UPI002225674B|nr:MULTISPECIES: hypothetical protein [unclassified Flavobacterium]WDO13091.1 hypothetical protein MH928_17430 [Flavobacterium sp. WW92]
MKKFLFLLVLLPTINFAQDKISTTDEEYKYLTEGYKIQQETGSDFKSGYELQKIEENKANGFIITYSLLKHKESNKTKALSIVLTKEKDKKDKIVYLCLPFNNTDLFVKFCKETESLGVSMKMYFDYSIYNVLQKSLDKIANRM